MATDINSYSQFREVARELDHLVKVAEPDLLAGGIEITNETIDRNHYDPLMTWSYQFATDRPRGIEIERVCVTIELTEGDDPICKVQRRAELFQIGQISRWKNLDSLKQSISDLRQHGVASIVLSLIRQGQHQVSEVK